MKLKGLNTPGSCVLCGRPLDMTPGKWSAMEMDWRDGSFHPVGEVDPEFSQGAFEFGSTCAKKLTKKLKEAQQ